MTFIIFIGYSIDTIEKIFFFSAFIYYFKTLYQDEFMNFVLFSKLYFLALLLNFLLKFS